MADRSRTNPAPASGPGSDGSPDAARARPSGGSGYSEGSVVDRRLGIDRRDMNGGGGAPGDFDRRRGPGRRLSDFTRSAEEGELTQEQFMFLMAINDFKKANGKAFPAWTDVLEVIRLLGYRKTMRSEIALRNAEDWQEPPTAESGVRPENFGRRLSA